MSVPGVNYPIARSPAPPVVMAPGMAPGPNINMTRIAAVPVPVPAPTVPVPTVGIVKRKPDEVQVAGGAPGSAKKPKIAMGNTPIVTWGGVNPRKIKSRDEEANQMSIEDMKDVTKVVGIDTEREAELALEDQGEGMSESDFIDREEDLFAEFPNLQARVLTVAAKSGIKQISRQAVQIISLALQQRLRAMMEVAVSSSHHRREISKGRVGEIIMTRDLKAQIEALTSLSRRTGKKEEERKEDEQPIKEEQ
eukprot:Ihof_evm1s1010 gene=Ihof_evmTU1s1010